MAGFHGKPPFCSPLSTPFLGFFGLDARKNLVTKFGMTHILFIKVKKPYRGIDLFKSNYYLVIGWLNLGDSVGALPFF